MIILENDYISASFAVKGAELQSLKSKADSREYMWSGDPGYWAKFSPVLFPVVGGLKDNTYFFEDKEYHLPRHGFARDHEFKARKISETEVVFTLTHNEDTLKVFPFEFILELQYRLEGNQLLCTYHVINPALKKLLFSIGGHPAFAAPAFEDIKYSDYFLEFNNDDELTCHKIENDLIGNETITIKLKNRTLKLDHRLFYEDALVIKMLKSNCISLRNSKNTHGLHFKFHDFPFFGIWAAKDANFICIEPWCGIADGINHNQDLSMKEGIISLQPKEDWKRSWSVTCF